jgi:hypothetical protein
MKQSMLILSLWTIGNLAFSQDTTERKTIRPLYIEIGASENIPFQQDFNEVKNANPNAYYSYKSHNYLTFGYFASIGYEMPLHKKIFLIPNLSYYYLQEKKERFGDAFCSICDSPVDFSGFEITEKAFSSIALASSISIKLKHITFDNGIGVWYILKETSTFYSKNLKNNFENNYQSSTKDVFTGVYSYHKVGIELIKNRLDLFIGAYLFYDKSLTSGFNPNLSLKFKII